MADNVNYRTLCSQSQKKSSQKRDLTVSLGLSNQTKKTSDNFLGEAVCLD
jgi:hypothetical protein